MKRSRAVPLSLVSTLAAAALAAGCGAFGRRQGWQTCVDSNTNVAVDRQYCDDWTSQGRPYGFVPHYSWYYFPRGYYWDAPDIGQRVPVGGSFSATPHGSAPMAHSGAQVSRGGFGSTAAGRAGSGS